MLPYRRVGQYNKLNHRVNRGNVDVLWDTDECAGRLVDVSGSVQRERRVRDRGTAGCCRVRGARKSAGQLQTSEWECTKGEEGCVGHGRMHGAVVGVSGGNEGVTGRNEDGLGRSL